MGILACNAPLFRSTTRTLVFFFCSFTHLNTKINVGNRDFKPKAQDSTSSPIIQKLDYFHAWSKNPVAGSWARPKFRNNWVSCWILGFWFIIWIWNMNFRTQQSGMSKNTNLFILKRKSVRMKNSWSNIVMTA